MTTKLHPSNRRRIGRSVLLMALAVCSLSSFKGDNTLRRPHVSGFFYFIIHDNTNAWFSHGASFNSDTDASNFLKDKCAKQGYKYTQRVFGPYSTYDYAEEYRGDAMVQWQRSGIATHDWDI